MNNTDVEGKLIECQEDLNAVSIIITSVGVMGLIYGIPMYDRHYVFDKPFWSIYLIILLLFSYLWLFL